MIFLRQDDPWHFFILQTVNMSRDPRFRALNKFDFKTSIAFIVCDWLYLKEKLVLNWITCFVPKIIAHLCLRSFDGGEVKKWRSSGTSHHGITHPVWYRGSERQKLLVTIPLKDRLVLSNYRCPTRNFSPLPTNFSYMWTGLGQNLRYTQYLDSSCASMETISETLLPAQFLSIFGDARQSNWVLKRESSSIGHWYKIS